jgi:hypothetical protein
MRILGIVALILIVLIASSVAPTAAQTSTPTATIDPCDVPRFFEQLDGLESTGDKEIDWQIVQSIKDRIAVLEKCRQGQVAAATTATPTAATTGTLSAADRRSATAQVRNMTATFVGQYKTIDRRELLSYANRHIGERVVVQGVVFNIAGDNEFQMYWAGTSDAIFVRTIGPLSGLYERDRVKVYGAIGGYEEFENSLGATITQPLLQGAIIVK